MTSPALREIQRATAELRSVPTFWRDELRRLIAEHRDAGHVLNPDLGGPPLLDPAYLDRWFWTVVERAGESERRAWMPMLKIAVNTRRVRNGRKQARAAVARRLQADRRREAVRLRSAQLRLAMAVRDRHLND